MHRSERRPQTASRALRAAPRHHRPARLAVAAHAPGGEGRAGRGRDSADRCRDHDRPRHPRVEGGARAGGTPGATAGEGRARGPHPARAAARLREGAADPFGRGGTPGSAGARERCRAGRRPPPRRRGRSRRAHQRSRVRDLPAKRVRSRRRGQHDGALRALFLPGHHCRVPSKRGLGGRPDRPPLPPSDRLRRLELCVLQGRGPTRRGATHEALRADDSASLWRRPVTDRPFDVPDLEQDPLSLFQQWLDEARAASRYEAEAMAVATADAMGAPSLRMVLLKGCAERGLTFFTNYGSRKGTDLGSNPQAALLFHWPTLGRQVRVEGTVTRVDRAETEAYARSRPRASQLSALASPQSRPVPDRQWLERKVEELEREHAEGELPVRQEWGGYRVEPHAWEFWQNRDNRLHDRFRYERQADGWSVERLAP